MKKIIIIALAVVILAGGAALYFFVFRSTEEKPVELFEYPLEFFVTNVANSNRMLKATVVLVVNDKKLPETLAAEKNTIIRDTILFILRDLTVDEISATGRQDDLRKKIINAVNNKLGIDNIVEVRFNDFVMQ